MGIIWDANDPEATVDSLLVCLAWLEQRSSGMGDPAVSWEAYNGTLNGCILSYGEGKIKAILALYGDVLRKRDVEAMALCEIALYGLISTRTMRKLTDSEYRWVGRQCPMLTGETRRDQHAAVKWCMERAQR